MVKVFILVFLIFKMSSLPQLLDGEHSQVSGKRVEIIEERCPHCGSEVSYALGPGNAFCKNPECMKLLYES
jgi:hypothetical protein